MYLNAMWADPLPLGEMDFRRPVYVGVRLLPLFSVCASLLLRNQQHLAFPAERPWDSLALWAVDVSLEGILN